MGAYLYTWPAGHVTLSLNSGSRLKWSMWSLAPPAIKRFTTENGLRGTQFVLLWHGIGPVGYGRLNTTTTTLSTKATEGFPDPCSRHFALTSSTIEFYGYQGSIYPVGLLHCMEGAYRDVERYVEEGERSMTVVAPYFSYSAGGVNLFLQPNENLTWHLWSSMPFYIQQFVTENEFKGTQFILFKEDGGLLGYGHLINESISVLSVPRPNVSLSV